MRVELQAGLRPAAVTQVSSVARSYLILVTKSGAELQVARRSRDKVRKVLGL